MPWPEVYAALETKAIDGQENPYAIIQANKLDEVQKYLTTTKHSYSPYVIMVGKKFWEKLTADEQKVLQDSCLEARDYQRKVSREEDIKIIADLKQKGMVINELSPEDRTKLQSLLKPVADKYTQQVGEDLVKQTYAEIERAKSKN
jgi:TRAP-type C4-dicarboxylate transport system substrate-binding protein